MLVLLSPATKLDFETPARSTLGASVPALLGETRELSKVTRKLTPKELEKLMALSEPLAQLNFERFQAFDARARRPKSARAAAFAFDGDTYAGLRAREFSDEEMAFAQEHLRILSGLYGLLRPLDLIQPYRLEMGSRLRTERGGSLYDFWGQRIARRIRQELRTQGAEVVVNLASTEYFSAVDLGALGARVVTPIFKEKRGGAYRVVSFSAKRARGSMARFVVERRLLEPEGLKKFTRDGYRFDKAGSSDEHWLFLRDSAGRENAR